MTDLHAELTESYVWHANWRTSPDYIRVYERLARELEVTLREIAPGLNVTVEIDKYPQAPCAFLVKSHNVVDGGDISVEMWINDEATMERQNLVYCMESMAYEVGKCILMRAHGSS